MAALRSLLARTTTLCRARAPSGPVCVAPRMSSASSSRRYTSQGGYGRNWDKEFDRQRTDQHLRKFREDLDLIKKPSRSDKIWSFVEPIAVVLGLSLYTAACLGAGYGVGCVHGYCVGFVDGVKFPKAMAEMIHEVVAKMKLDEWDDDVEETIGEVANVKLDGYTDDDVEETIGEVAKMKLDESTDDDVDDDVEEAIDEVAKVKLDESTDDEIV